MLITRPHLILSAPHANTFVNWSVYTVSNFYKEQLFMSLDILLFNKTTYLKAHYTLIM